jgi:hypothetical protein
VRRSRSVAGEQERDCLRGSGRDRRCGGSRNFTPETYLGVTDEMLAPLLKDTMLGRLPRLADLAGTAVYLASDVAGAVSGAMVNLTCRAIVD